MSIIKALIKSILGENLKELPSYFTGRAFAYAPFGGGYCYVEETRTRLQFHITSEAIFSQLYKLEKSGQSFDPIPIVMKREKFFLVTKLNAYDAHGMKVGAYAGVAGGCSVPGNFHKDVPEAWPEYMDR